MTQLNDEHLELHSKNRAERYERQKLTYLEDRIATLEKSLGRVIDIVIHNSGDALEDLKKEENNHE